MRLFTFKNMAAGFALAAMGLLAFVGTLLWLTERDGPLAQAKIIWVQPGQSLSGVAMQLEKDGVVRSATVLKLAGRLANKPIRAGEYTLPAKSSIADVLARLQNGATYQRQITIPEGWTNREVFAAINSNPYLTGDIGTFETLSEGVLLPETYGFDRGTSRQDLLRRMQEDHEQAVQSLLQSDLAMPPEFGKLDRDPVESLLIVASIVEKEAGHDAERGRIARAFLNRIGKGMKLEADPTVIYAVELAQGGEPLNRPLSRKDLKTPSPYNTYVSGGIPPGPICNPGIASIRAVLEAPSGNELFFVADGTGGHAFAETLAEHNKNVRAWRAVERARKTAN